MDDESPMLERLFGSRLRAKLLGWFFTHSDERYFIRQLELLLKENATNISRELIRLETMGILVSKRVGNQKHYQANKKCPFFQELKGLILKTLGVAGTIREGLKEFSGVKYAFIYGSFAKKIETAESDVDLMLIGKIDLNHLDDSLPKIEKKLGRTINYTYYTLREFNKKRKAGDGFIKNVLKDEKIMLVGSKDELIGA